MNEMSFSSRAAMARKRAGFSDPGKAAKAIGCARTTVVGWEDAAGTGISSRYLHAAARAYRVRPEWLTMESADDGYPFIPGEPGATALPERDGIGDNLRTAFTVLRELHRMVDIDFGATTEEESVIAALEYLHGGGDYKAVTSIVVGHILSHRGQLNVRAGGDTAAGGAIRRKAAPAPIRQEAE